MRNDSGVTLHPELAEQAFRFVRVKMLGKWAQRLRSEGLCKQAKQVNETADQILDEIRYDLVQFGRGEEAE